MFANSHFAGQCECSAMLYFAKAHILILCICILLLCSLSANPHCAFASKLTLCKLTAMLYFAYAILNCADVRLRFADANWLLTNA